MKRDSILPAAIVLGICFLIACGSCRRCRRKSDVPGSRRPLQTWENEGGAVPAAGPQTEQPATPSL